MTLAPQATRQQIAVRCYIVDNKNPARNPAPSRFLGVVDGGDGAQQIGHDLDRSDLLGARSTAGFAGAVDHDIDLRKQVVRQSVHLFEVGNQRLLRTIRYFFRQKLAVSFDGVERSAQIVAQAALERIKVLVLPAHVIGLVDQTIDEARQLGAGDSHAVEIGNRVVETEALGIHGDDV